MACHKHSFHSFDAIMDNPPLAVGHTLASPHQRSYGSACLELLEDHGCSLCAEPHQAKSITTKTTGTQCPPSYQPQSQSHQHIHRKPIRPEGSPVEGATHHYHHHKYSKRIVLVKNTNPSIQKTILLHRTPVGSLGVFMDDVSELMQCLIKKLYTLDGHKIDSIQSLLQCPSILVCVGCEPFHPFLLDSSQRCSDDKLPRLVLKSHSSICNEEPGCKKNGSFGPKIKRSVPPGRMGAFYQARPNMVDDDIEKRVLVNKDGSLSMEMKVRFRLLNNETLHCSTEIKKSSDIYNVGLDNACCVKHGNGEQCSQTQSVSAYELDDSYITNLHQKHVDTTHCRHCCIHCKEYDIWKNPAFVEERTVRYITSSSSSTSSHKIRRKKASVDSMHTVSSEEYTEQVVEKATCVQQTVGDDGDTIVEFSTASRCCSRGEVCSVTEKTKNTSYTNETSEQCESPKLLVRENKQSIPSKELQHNQVKVQITQISKEEVRLVFVETSSSLNEDEYQEETDCPAIPENDKEGTNAASSPHSLIPCKLSESPVQSLLPRTPSMASTCSLKSEKSRNTNGEVENGTFEEILDANKQPEDVLLENNTNDAVSEVRSLSSMSVLSTTDGNFEHDTEESYQTIEMESDIPTQLNAHENLSISAVYVVEGPADITDNQERVASSTSSKSNISAKSRQSKLSGVSSKQIVETNLQIEERTHSAMSVSSNASTISKQSSYSELLTDECVSTEDQTLTPVSTTRSFRFSPDLREVNDQLDERASSVSYIKSDISVASPVQLKSPDRVPNAMSTRSNNSAKSNKSKILTDRPLTTSNRELQERAQSVMSAKSNISVISITSNISEVIQQENRVEGDTSEERALGAQLIKSNTAARSDKTKASAVAPEETVHGESEKSVLSSKSVASTKSTKSKGTFSNDQQQERNETSFLAETNDFETSKSSKSSEIAMEESDFQDEPENQPPMSANSITSPKTNNSEISECVFDFEAEQAEGSKSANPARLMDQTGQRTPSTVSVKSDTSKRSKKSSVTQTIDSEFEVSEERSPSAISSKSNISKRSMKSSVSEFTHNESESLTAAVSLPQECEQPDKRPVSSISNASVRSRKSGVSNVSQTKQTSGRPQSGLSARSNVSARSIKSTASETHAQRQETDHEDMRERALSSMSCKSMLSDRSDTSEMSDKQALASCNKEAELKQTGERSRSALSVVSNVSGRSIKTTISEAPEQKNGDGDINERSPSVMSFLSDRSDKSKFSDNPALEPGENIAQRRSSTEERPASDLSRISIESKKSVVSDYLCENETKQTSEKTKTALSCSVCANSKKSHRQGKGDENNKRAPSSMSCKSDFSDRSDKSNVLNQTKLEPVVVDNNQEQKGPNTEESLMSPVSRTSIKSKKSVLSTGPCERPNSASSAISTVSVRSINSKGSETHMQNSEDDKERDLSAMKCILTDNCDKSKEDLEPAMVNSGTEQSTISAKSNDTSTTVMETEKTCTKRIKSRAESSMSNKSSRSKKSNGFELATAEQMLERAPVGEFEQDLNFKTEKRAPSSMSVKSSVCSISQKSRNLETEDLNERSASVLSVESNESAKSNKSKMGDEKEHLERKMTPNFLKASGSVRYVCSSLNTSSPVTETLENNVNEKRAASVLSERLDASGKSNTSSVHSTSEEDLTPASASVSIGIVEEYNVDSADDTSVNSNSKSDISCKVSLKVNEPKNQSPTQTQDDRPETVMTKTHFSEKSKKSECSNSNSLPITDTKCRKTIKSTTTNRTRERKSPVVNDRPKSTSFNASYHLEVKEQISNAKSQPNIIDHSNQRFTNADEASRSNSANLSESSKNQLITDNNRKVNKSSEKKSESKQSTSSNPLQQNVDNNLSELVPSVLPSSSPTEVVNEWLKKIPLDSPLYDAGDELHKDYENVNRINMSGNVTQDEKGNRTNKASDAGVFESENQQEPQLVAEEVANRKDDVEEVNASDITGCTYYQRKNIQESCLDSHTSVQLMRILLNPKVGRCNSLPEVSSVYGQKLSTSARGLLDCLVNLQLLDFDPNDTNGKAEKYRDLMNMLKSLWLCDPSDCVAIPQKNTSKVEQFTDNDIKVKSSLGMYKSSSSIVFGKSSVNENTKAQNTDDTDDKDAEMLTENQVVNKTEKELVVKEVETRSDPATPDIASRVRWTPENEKEKTVEQMKDSNISASDDASSNNDSPRGPLDTPLSNNSYNYDCDARQQDTSSETTPSEQRTNLMKKAFQDPDPVWVLNLLNKIEKQFMTHYVAAMAEFKVRWNLDDSEQFDEIIEELKNEVHKMIQSCINKEIRKIQSRAGAPRPPKETLSRTSTIQTEERRRRLKVMLNQSIDQPARNNDNYTVTDIYFSDQRGDDENCPCDTCVTKRMASKPVLPKKILNSAPVMTNFDLRKILHMKNEAPINNKQNVKETKNDDHNAEVGNLTKNVLLEDTEMQDVPDDINLEAADEKGKSVNEPADNTDMCKAETTTNEKTSDQETAEDAQTADIDLSESAESIKSMAEDDGEIDGDVAGNNRETIVDEIEEETEDEAEGEYTTNGKMVKSQSASECELEEEGTSGQSALEDVKGMAKAETAVDGEQKHDSMTEDEEDCDEATNYKKPALTESEDEDTIEGNSPDNGEKVNDKVAKHREISDVTEEEVDEAPNKTVVENEDTANDEPDKAAEPEQGDMENVEETSEAETADNGEQDNNGIALEETGCAEATDCKEITETESEQNIEIIEDKIVDDGKTTDEDKAVDEEISDGTAENGETIDDETDRGDISEGEETPTAKIGDTEDTVDDETEEDRELGGLNEKESKEITESQTAEDGHEDDDGIKYGDTGNDEASDFEETDGTEREEDAKTTEPKTEGEISDDVAKTDKDISNDEAKTDREISDDETAEEGHTTEGKETSNTQMEENEDTTDYDCNKDEETSGSNTEHKTLKYGEHEVEYVDTDKTQSEDHATSEDEDKTEGRKTLNAKMVDFENTDEEEDGETDGSGMANIEETTEDETAKNGKQEADGITDGLTGLDETTDNVETDGTEKKNDGETTEAKTSEDEERVNEETIEEEDKAVGEETPIGKFVEDEDTDDDGPADSEPDGYKMDQVKETPIGTTAEDSEQEKSGFTDGEASNDESTKREEDGETTEAKTTEDGETVNDATENSDTADYTGSENGEEAGTLNEKTEIAFAENGEAVKGEAMDGNNQRTSEKGHLCSSLIHTGESIKEGDESESYIDTDKREQAIKIPAVRPPTWSSNKADQPAKSKSASFYSAVKMYTGSEDGADADGEDSETEVQARNGNAEYNDIENDCQCTCGGLYYRQTAN